MGWSQQNANEFPDVSTTRTIQPGDINTTHSNSLITNYSFILSLNITFDTELKTKLILRNAL